VTPPPDVEGLLRDLAPKVLASLARRSGDFDRAEDAVQDALVSAAAQWPIEGVPTNPRGWLLAVATRRRIEAWRRDAARRTREETARRLEPSVSSGAPAADDSLALFLLCCHPSLTPVSQVALTLRAVGGLTTAEIARALLVPEGTIGQRISRAKTRIKESGGAFTMPLPDERDQRIAAVLSVLYLIFNEGYTASSGKALVRVELTSEAIRLTRQLHALLPDEGEVAGLLALMLLTDARRPARIGSDGMLVPLADQDRGLWDRAAIGEGLALVRNALANASIGPYQIQAAIAAVHDEAPTAQATDWRQILALYDLLRQLAPGPMVSLNRAVALAMVEGPRAGLDALASIEADAGLAGHHRVDAVRAHLLEMAGDRGHARVAYRRAARRTQSGLEKRYLEGRAMHLDERGDPRGDYDQGNP
jgi:RNA polymerase sigma factor (sigma-70 family)